MFAFLIAVFSATLGRTYGIIGMVAPWLVVGAAYLFVDAILGGLSALVDELDARS